MVRLRRLGRPAGRAADVEACHSPHSALAPGNRGHGARVCNTLLVTEQRIRAYLAIP